MKAQASKVREETGDLPVYYTEWNRHRSAEFTALLSDFDAWDNHSMLLPQAQRF